MTKAARAFAAVRDERLQPLYEQMAAGEVGAQQVYDDAVRAQIKIGQLVRLNGLPNFRLAIVIGFGDRCARYRVCKWSGIGSRRRFYMPRLEDLVHPLRPSDLYGRRGASVRAAVAAIESNSGWLVVDAGGNERRVDEVSL